MELEDRGNIVNEIFHGKYVFEELLGSSSFSEIYLIRHVFLDDLRVLKIIKKHLNSDFNLILSEAKTACKLKHENIIDIYDAGIVPAGVDEKYGFVYFVMEYIPGGDLSKYIVSFVNSNMLIPIYWTLYLIKHISLALSFMHLSNPPIVHGDIKASNILLSFNSQDRIVVKLSDFGFSRQINSNFADFGIVGTRQFMAPECFRNEFYPSTDIYALGVIFYILLTNHFPYDINKFSMVEISEGKPWRMPLMPPSSYNDKISSKLDNIVMKCLDINYKDRFLDANELLDVIEKFIDSYYLDEESYIINNTVKKAFRLALYENNLDEAIDILKDSDMVTILEEVISLDSIEDLSFSKTVHVESLSEIMKNKKNKKEEIL